MVEGRICPGNHIVAGLAGLREASGDMVRHVATKRLCAVPIGCVAGITSCARQIVIVTGVALIAIGDDAGRRHLVIPGESPSRRSVAPGSGGKDGGNRVAVGAVGDGERGSSGGVHRVIRAGVIGLVAILVGATGRSLQVVTTRGSCVALGAL